MPAVYQVSCDKCDFNYSGPGAYIYVLLEDGERNTLPHPLEAETALEITGKDFERLKKEGLIGMSIVHCCVKCAKLMTFDRDKDELKCPECEDSEVKEIITMSGNQCPKCNDGILNRETIGWS